jgi:hypothetical protein
MTMKLLSRSGLLVLITCFVVACSQPISTPTDNNAMIEPGDKIGDFLITTGDNEGVSYLSIVHCPVSGENETCTFSVGTKVNVAWGLYDDTYSGKLDSLWAEHSYQMVIGGHPVNLQAFGSIDITHPMVGAMRAWNVVILTDKPGEITIQHSGVTGGNPFKGATRLIFNAP